MFPDLHTHSRFSHDADKDYGTIQNMCSRAVAIGLSDLAVTDHLDINAYIVDENHYRYDDALREFEAARDTFGDRLNLIHGIELGNPHHAPAFAREWMAAHRFDMVIGSLHCLVNEKSLAKTDFSTFSPEELHAYFCRYLDQNMEILDYGHIDVLAHLTYPHRYFFRTAGVKTMDFNRYRDRYEAIFKKMIARDVCLELNVSGIWQGMGFPITHPNVLRMYYECGGRLVTVGSDAHTPANIGMAVAEGMDILSSIGFTEICTWRNGERRLLPLSERI